MYIGVDLGSTNLKAALYDENMILVDIQSLPVTYIRENGFVEFDGNAYVESLLQLLGKLVRDNGVVCKCQIALTGQAESLAVVDGEGKLLMNVISWMDERSTEECAELAKLFSPALCEEITGQQAVLPTWPATKILWLKRHRPEIFEKAACYMLLKDYVVYRLTGIKAADMSIATFSFYFDIYNRVYWADMLSAIGITEEKLPPLQESCTRAGSLLPEVAEKIGVQAGVNIGTLDHFAGMIGTGNVAQGGITLSTGTVMALACMASEKTGKHSGIAMHYGFLPDTHIMLPVAESGGVSLEWFKKTCMGSVDYDTMNRELSQRGDSELLFLPYLVGTNAPEFDGDATGVFWGLRQEHDCIDMAGAVMEGVSFVLRKNIDYMRQNGVQPTAIVATGGGAKSPVWCQMQADITGLPVQIPAEKEAACLGAAMIAAVSAGKFADYSQAADRCVRFEKTYTPNPTPRLDKKYRRFCALYEASLKINSIE